ncbi:hypothetical protein [Mesorhizobium sp. Cs1299R1N3]|uniref:hypothetical protein n=1 Tax=Mesorhizobium sp. Cs1299R1N3 TaxID=3015173 RepID=UPI00301BB4FF
MSDIDAKIAAQTKAVFDASFPNANAAPTEQERMNATLNAISLRIIFANARRMVRGTRGRQPNWALARDLFGLGSTYATALCRRIGVNPDGFSADPARGHGGGDLAGVGRDAKHDTEPTATASRTADPLAEQ